MQKQFIAVFRNVANVPQLCLNCLLTEGVTNGDCNGKMASVRFNRAMNNDYVMTILRHYFFIFVWGKNEID